MYFSRVLISTALLALALVSFGLVEAAKPRPPEENINPADYNTFGTLWLDAIVWDKVIPNQRAHTLVMVTNKWAVGKQAVDAKRKEFMRLGRESDNNELLFTQVVVNGAENLKLAEEVIGFQNPGKQLHPHFFLIKKGEDRGISLQDGRSAADMEMADIMKLCADKTGMYMGLPGTSEVLSSLAGRFNAVGVTTEQRQAIVQETRSHLDSLPGGGKANSVDLTLYIKTMEKIIEKNDDLWAKKEAQRLMAILSSDKVSEARKDEFRKRVNVLGTFPFPHAPEPEPEPVPVAVRQLEPAPTVGADGTPLE